MEKTILGIDFGTDSVRTVVINAETGNELASEVADYSRWSKGHFCDPGKNQFRQHPLDYTEGLEQSVKGALAKLGMAAARCSPVAVAQPKAFGVAKETEMPAASAMCATLEKRNRPPVSCRRTALMLVVIRGEAPVFWFLAPDFRLLTPGFFKPPTIALTPD